MLTEKIIEVGEVRSGEVTVYVKPSWQGDKGSSLSSRTALGVKGGLISKREQKT